MWEFDDNDRWSFAEVCRCKIDVYRHGGGGTSLFSMTTSVIGGISAGMNGFMVAIMAGDIMDRAFVVAVV